MPIEERWVRNGAVRLHCLEQESDAALTPFLIVPGTFGVAEDYVQVMEALAPRRCIGVSLHDADAPTLRRAAIGSRIMLMISLLRLRSLVISDLQ